MTTPLAGLRVLAVAQFGAGPSATLRLSRELPEPSRAPQLGEDTEEVLRELCGYGAERIAELDAAGALGTRS
jgi:crotonobetainyl-CoA:carnitine CoA-transferase CaiB-like acyl-CoA transferase